MHYIYLIYLFNFELPILLEKKEESKREGVLSDSKCIDLEGLNFYRVFERIIARCQNLKNKSCKKRKNSIIFCYCNTLLTVKINLNSNIGPMTPSDCPIL